jgi:4-hydroxybenzoate polyprenyltransferase
VWLGPAGALKASVISHLLCGLVLVVIVVLLSQTYPQLGMLLYAGSLVFLAMLWYQHRIVRHDDLSRVGLAFFTTNGVASVLFGTACILDFYL